MSDDLVTYWHPDGTRCAHRLCRDSEAPDGLYCRATGSDVLLGGGAPAPATTPPPSRYLDGGVVLRRRHLAQRSGMFDSWPSALWILAVWVVLSGLVIGGLSLVAWALLHVLS